jgi:hypothetical protein
MTAHDAATILACTVAHIAIAVAFCRLTRVR